jgi:hypothetical protein
LLDAFRSTFPTYQNHGDSPWLRLSNPYPNELTQPAGNTLGLLNDVGYGANGPLRTAAANKTPYEQSWSLGFERELPANIVINAEYIGKIRNAPRVQRHQLCLRPPRLVDREPADDGSRPG